MRQTPQNDAIAAPQGHKPKFGPNEGGAGDRGR